MVLTAMLPGMDEPPRRPLGKDLDGGDDHARVVPDGVESYTWTVNEIEGSFATTVTKGRDSFQPWRLDVTVPRQGAYDIELSVQTRNGTIPNRRVFRIRDLLMVSIGESFASGQGNPDLRAVPSESQARMCEATTLAMLRTELAKTWDDYQDLIADNGGWLGKLTALQMQGVEDLAGAIEDVTGRAVDFFTDLGRAVFGGSSGPAPRPARWQEPYAYRSYQSGPARAAYLLESESATHADRVTFLSFARTGAEIRAGLLGPRTLSNGQPIDGWIGNIGEIEEVVNTVRDRPIDILHISIGGNDIRFGPTLTEIVGGDIPTLAAFTPWALALQAGNDVDARRELVTKAEALLDTFRVEGLPALANAVAALNPHRVYINEYPVGLFERMDAAGNLIDGPGCEVSPASTPTFPSTTGWRSNRWAPNSTGTSTSSRPPRAGP
jgi:hypothetical protein